jgi:hypothetical protein
MLPLYQTSGEKLVMSDQKFCFQGNEIVRLKHDHPDDNLKAGDCGLVWGVYDLDPPIYEASFVDQSGEFVDVMFQKEEVEELSNPQEARFIGKLEELRIRLEEFEARLKSSEASKS